MFHRLKFVSSSLLCCGTLSSSLLSLSQSKCEEKSKEWDYNWDMRNDNNKSKVVHRIVLVRHGQYVHGSNDEERILTSKGREQAILCGKRIQELVDGGRIFPIKHIYYSTMTRATETHHLILQQLTNIKIFNDQPCSMIREGAVYRPNPSSISWLPSDESFFKDNCRVEAAFVNHIHRADSDETSNYSTLLVCHGNVIRYIVCRALQLPKDHWLRLAVYNASITVIDIHSNGKVSLIGLGDVGYLKPDMITYD